MIKTLFFDFGGVIYRTPILKWISRWKKLFGLENNPEILAMLENPNESSLVTDICLGKIPEDQLWGTMAEKWHVKPTVIQTFRRKMASKRHLNKAILKLMAASQRNYQTAILSNAGDQSRDLMVNVFHLDRLVDEIIISAEEGCIKPDHKIFEIAMSRMGSKPEESLLLDDFLVNVLSAREFGLHAVQFIKTEQAIQAFQYELKKDR